MHFSFHGKGSGSGALTIVKKVQDLITAADRGAVLRAAQSREMARSAHAYVRGSALQFYQWLKSARHTAIPRGLAVWICGDCHVGNLGPVARAEGDVEVQIRDLDRCVVGNPAHDLIRLALSLASAARWAVRSGTSRRKGWSMSGPPCHWESASGRWKNQRNGLWRRFSPDRTCAVW